MNQGKRMIVDKNTRWECQKCMECCKTNKEIMQKIMDVKTDKEECAFLKDNKCSMGENKPLICKLYPFFPGVTQTKISFAIGKLTLMLSCKGVGKGQKISENKELLKKIGKNAKELMERVAMKSQGKIKDVFEEKRKSG